MPLKTISLILVAPAEPESAPAIRYALDLASRCGAALNVRIGVPPLIVPDYPASPALLSMIQQENVELTRRSELTAGMIRQEALGAGIIAQIEILAQPYEPLVPHFSALARLSDLCVAQAPPADAAQRLNAVVDVVIGGKAPTLLVPAAWGRRGAAAKAIVAWDGSASCARAVRDALPLLGEVQTVEIVSVTGESGAQAGVPGADLAPFLARHGAEVTTNLLPNGEGGVAGTVYAHAKMTRADLVVMGAYGHSRFREFVLGGATRDALTNVAVPTLIAH